VRDCFAEVLGSEWNTETDAAWGELLREIDAIVAQQTSKHGMEV